VETHNEGGLVVLAGVQMGLRARRTFTTELKAGTIALIRSSGKSIGAICRDLGLTETAVRRWVHRAEVDAGKRPGMATIEQEESTRLRREDLVLRQGREILVKAAAFFAKEATR
jgi:transposase-like protein